jgi:hypothetical protein
MHAMRACVRATVRDDEKSGSVEKPDRLESILSTENAHSGGFVHPRKETMLAHRREALTVFHLCALFNTVFGVSQCQSTDPVGNSPNSPKSSLPPLLHTPLWVVPFSEFHLVQASQASYIPLLDLLGELSYLPSLDPPLLSTQTKLEK